VPLDLRPGSTVPIPCRHCARACASFIVREGQHEVTCEKCGSTTEVQVYVDGGTWLVKTAKAGRVRPRA